jgi:hypothetical protein
MYKCTVLFLLLLGGMTGHAQVSNEIRLSYKNATQSKENALAFFEKVKSYQMSDEPVLVAYKGAGLMLLARYEPLTQRTAKVKDAVEWIENAVKRDPEKAEIRLIRLSVQENLPKMLGYHKDQAADRAFIEKAYPNLKDENLKQMIEGYFAEFSKKQ